MKALHIISVIAWMAGMLYLPRLFVYHATAAPGSELSETLKVMERRLLRFIINPAMIAAFLFGGALIYITKAGAPGTGYWMHAKIALILALAALHGMMARHRKAFFRDANTHTARYYRIFNELVTVCMVAIVLLAVLKPF